MNNDEDKRKENEEVEEVESISENDLKEIIENAIKDSQKKNTRIILTQEILDKMVEDRMNEIEKNKIDKDIKKKNVESRYNEFEGKKKVLKILSDEREKILIKLATLEPGSKEYDETYNNYRKVNESYEEVRNNPFHKIDWTKIVTTLIIIGACGALVFLLLIVENSPYFPRSRNALAMIMNLVKAGIKL